MPDARAELARSRNKQTQGGAPASSGRRPYPLPAVAQNVEALPSATQGPESLGAPGEGRGRRAWEQTLRSVQFGADLGPGEQEGVVAYKCGRKRSPGTHTPTELDRRLCRS